MNEFGLIKKYFQQLAIGRQDVLLGIGDDCALLQPPAKQALAVTTDTLLAGVHFSANAAPYDIGYKSLAVNLSDLAAMGAEPAWISLSLTLPKADEAWIAEFCQGFAALATPYGLQLIGGDTSQGPLSISVTVHGFVPVIQALRRDAAKPNDKIYVTGTLGDAGAALAWLKQERSIEVAYRQALLARLHRPMPRIQEGLWLAGLAHAAIDVSDGLAADLGHILAASGVGARLYIDKLPISYALAQAVPQDIAWQLALTAGDDYELCFTMSSNNQSSLAALAIDCTCIGEITLAPGLCLQFSDGTPYDLPKSLGYQHFG
jgi:thiamine-monophosphate kinase